jgi:acetolactate synthase-1/3 small subunit
VDDGGRLSRITIVTSGTEMVIEQIKAQLDRLVPVHKVSDLTLAWPAPRARAGADQGGRRGRPAGGGAAPGRCLPARVVDATTESFVFEMTGTADKVDAFLALMRPLGLAEVSRTGAVAIARGAALLAA